MDKRTVKQLRQQAKDAGIKGYSKWKKQELIDALTEKPKPTNKSVDKLYFYSKSKDVEPGKGANEQVADQAAYDKLSKIKEWRKVLSNFHLCPFTFKGHTYNTIEHVFQSVKIALADKDAAFRFTLESKDPIGLGDGAVAQKHRKLIKLTPDQLAKWDSMKFKLMKDAAKAKYKQCKEAKETLLLTGNAQLWHIVQRSKPVRFDHLEQIRTEMQ